MRQGFIAHFGPIAATDEESEAWRFADRDSHRRALLAARQAILAMRASDEIGDDAFHRIEEELDWLDMSGGVRDAGSSRRKSRAPATKVNAATD